MTPRRKREALAAIYSKIPSLECKRLCAPQCRGDIPIRRVEVREMRKRLPMIDQHVHSTPNGMPHVRVPWRVLYNERGACPAFDGKGCTVHDVRPFICRVWGTVDTLSCPYGCVPSRVLTDAEARELERAVNALDEQKEQRP